MAKKTSGKKSNRKVESDYSAEISKNIKLDIYEKKNGVKAKLTLCDAFVIFCKVIETKKGAFLSYPSFKTKDDEYVNMAYCFDKETIEAINAELDNYLEED